MRTVSAEVALVTNAQLGEGSLWDDQRGLLYWVDIAGHRVHAFQTKDRTQLSFDIGESVVAIVPTRNEQLLIALRHGFAWLDPNTGDLCRLKCTLNDKPGQRFNDGKCDPAGRFWIGTMVETDPPGAGSLYCLTPDLHLETKIEGVSCSNGLVWSRDQSTFYYIDTPTQEIAAYNYEPSTGRIDRRRVVATIPPAIGAPDGMTIDAEDQLWVALWGGRSVLRIDPSTGQTTFKVELPVSDVTSCAFGGPDLDELFITTATVGLNAQQRESEPLAGSLFSVKLPFCGVRANRFGRASQN